MDDRGFNWSKASQEARRRSKTVLKLADFSPRVGAKQARPSQVTFYSALHKDSAGMDRTLVISVTVAGGDASALIERVIKKQGIGVTRNGIWHWMPWPCAALEVRSVAPSNDESAVPRMGGAV
jgi:hypothetical protein